MGAAIGAALLQRVISGTCEGSQDWADLQWPRMGLEQAYGQAPQNDFWFADPKVSLLRPLRSVKSESPQRWFKQPDQWETTPCA